MCIRDRCKVAMALAIATLGAGVSAEACTDLIVGPKASTDGSVFISYEMCIRDRDSP